MRSVADTFRMRRGTGLLAAGARARRADVRNNHAGKAGRVEARGDDIGLEHGLAWDPLGTDGFPEGIAFHFARVRSLALWRTRACELLAASAFEPALWVALISWQAASAGWIGPKAKPAIPSTATPILKI